MQDKPLLDSPGPQQNDIEGAMRKISKGIEDMIYGPAADQVAATLKQDPSPQAVAAILYKPARQAIEQAEQAGLDVGDDFIFGVVTDGIDILLEILEASGQIKGEEAIQDFREEALMQILMLHAEQVGDDPEQQMMAQESLAQLAQDGTLENAIREVESRARSKGIDPQEFRAQGQQMVAPKQNPLAAGITEGLA